MTTNPHSWRQWPVATAMADLTEGTIQVLAFNLDVSDETARELEGTLSAPERARAKRLVYAADARRYIVSRGVLRSVLSGILRCGPQDVTLEAGASGKPRLAGESPAAQFNVSHSMDLALIALSVGREVGVDLEHHDPRMEWRSVARTWLSGEQCEEIDGLGPALQLPAFYSCWSRKEAILKARGGGLSGRQAPLSASDKSWWVADVPVGPDHAASVASEAPRATLELYRWSTG